MKTRSLSQTIGLCLLGGICILFALSAVSRKPAREIVLISKSAVDNKGNVTLYTDVADLHRANSLTLQEIAMLMHDSKLRSVDSQSRAQVLKEDGQYLQVRVISGDQAGMVGWVNMKNVDSGSGPTQSPG
jgi:hypothetical protein